MIEEHEYDVVISDLVMPPHHGYHFVAELLAHPSRPAIVLFTGYPEETVVRSLLRRGLDCVVHKADGYGNMASSVCETVESKRTQGCRDTEVLSAFDRDDSCPANLNDGENAIPASTNQQEIKPHGQVVDESTESLNLSMHDSAHEGVPVQPSLAEVSTLPGCSADREVSAECTPHVLRKNSNGIPSTALYAWRSFDVNAVRDVLVQPLLWCVFGATVIISFGILLWVSQSSSQNDLLERLREAGVHVVENGRDTMHVDFHGKGGTLTIVRAVRQLRGVQSADFGASDADDAVAREISQMSRITHLDFSGTTITDDGVCALSGIARMERLNLAHTMITNSAIECLVELKALREIDLRDTRVTRDGVRRLKQALPLTNVLW